MVAETTTTPPAEDVAASEPVPKVTTDPSILTEPASEQEKTESRDVVDTPKSGEITPSSARNEFIFSPQVTKAKSSESKGSAVAEEAPAEESPAEVAEDKKEEEAVSAVDDEPAAEEPKEETPPAEEKVEEKAIPAPVEEPVPAEEEPSLIMSFLERATALCGAAQSAEIVKDDLAADEIASVSKTKSKESMSPIAKAKAAISCIPQDVNEDASVAQSSAEKTDEKDDLSMVLTEKEEAEEETEAVPAEEDKPDDEEEPKEVAEEPAVEEPAPVVEEVAPKKKKASMKKKMSQKIKGVKKVISFRTSKAKVVQSSE